MKLLAAFLLIVFACWAIWQGFSIPHSGRSEDSNIPPGEG
jgi:hypothetical protein